MKVSLRIRGKDGAIPQALHAGAYKITALAQKAKPADPNVGRCRIRKEGGQGHATIAIG
jgi:hypothetical protein